MVRPLFTVKGHRKKLSTTKYYIEQGINVYAEAKQCYDSVVEGGILCFAVG